MDDEPTPHGGYRMVIALTDLAAPEQRPLVEEYLRSLPVLHWDWLKESRDALWSGLVARAHRGEIEFHGIRAGASEPNRIHPAMLRGSRPDFIEHTLLAAGVLWHAVGVFPVADQEAGKRATACNPRPNLTPADWMAANVTAAGSWKRDAAVADCRKATGCTWREAVDAWSGLSLELRGARGARK